MECRNGCQWNQSFASALIEVQENNTWGSKPGARRGMFCDPRVAPGKKGARDPEPRVVV